MACVSCGSNEIEYADAKGETVCMSCGTVLEESSIVNAIGFDESASGAHSIVGKFVSGTSTRSYGGIAGGYGLSRESREIVIDKGKQTMQQLSSTLRLSQHVVDSSHRLFMLAVEHNFIQGRRTLNVIAACLYIVCRRERSEHLLIDFADLLQINVYSLGACFLKFTRLLSIQLPVIDPTLYIHRFAAKLDLGDKRHVVSSTALRMVQRMQRDWLHTGRRPAGICGAALFLAARIHGFDRSRDDVLRVVRVTDDTLRLRLLEFGNTASGALTAEEFESLELDGEGNPPCFTRNEIEEKLAAEGVTMEMLMDGDLVTGLTPLQPGSLDEVVVDPADAPDTEAQKKKVNKRLLEERELYCRLSQEMAPQLLEVQTARQQSQVPRPIVPTPPDAAGAPARLGVDEEALSDDDDLLLGCLLTAEDATDRHKAWLDLNQEYLKELEDRKKLGEPVPAPRKRRRNVVVEPAVGAAARVDTTDLALTAGPYDVPEPAPLPRKSKKLNYQALHGFAPTPAPAETEV